MLSRVTVSWLLAAAVVGLLGAAPQAPKTPPGEMFDTPGADRILAGLQVFPPDNPWNEDISARPVAPDLAAIIGSIGAEKSIGYNLDMNFVIVPPDQPLVPVRVTMYPAESDPGPFPVPSNAPIENWPMVRNEHAGALPKPGQTLEDIQRHGT